MSILLGILTFVLILVSILLVLIVLMQKAKNDGGMGAAMGGGMAEATFGADTSNVLSKTTINLAVAFFVLTFGLYLGRVYQRTQANAAAGSALPAISAPAAQPVAPATTFPTPGAPDASVTMPSAPAATGTETPAADTGKQP